MTKNIVVIGQGAAGLSAALAAAEAARAKSVAVAITLVDKAPGTRRRRQHPLDTVLYADGVGRSRRAVIRPRHAGGDAVPGRRRLLSPRSRSTAPATVKWIAGHGVPFHQPVYYLAKGPPRIQPVGGGETIHR
jgi:tricarballylate dehydrogenase